MRCTYCHGSGVLKSLAFCDCSQPFDGITPTDTQLEMIQIPCPECGGTGTLHCCEGLQEQASIED